MKTSRQALIIVSVAVGLFGLVQLLNWTSGEAATTYPPGQGGGSSVSSSNILWFTNVATGEIYNTNSAGLAVKGNITITGGDVINGGWGALKVAYIDTNLKLKDFPNGTGAFTNNGSGAFGWFPLSSLSSTATNLGTLVFPTNAGNVQFIDLPVASAVAGTAEGYSLRLAGTNMIEVIASADATAITNPIVKLPVGNLMVHTNAMATWPKIPTQPGAFCIVSSNGLPYILLSTNNAGGGSQTWTGTNKFGW